MIKRRLQVGGAAQELYFVDGQLSLPLLAPLLPVEANVRKFPGLIPQLIHLERGPSKVITECRLFGCGALGFLIYGMAPTGALFWIGIPVMSLWGVAGAAVQALTSRLVAPDQQGQLQGAINSVQSVSQLIGPFLFTLTFAYFISDQAPVKMPGAPFLLAAALLALALVIAWRTLAGQGRG